MLESVYVVRGLREEEEDLEHRLGRGGGDHLSYLDRHPPVLVPS